MNLKAFSNDELLKMKADSEALYNAVADELTARGYVGEPVQDIDAIEELKRAIVTMNDRLIKIEKQKEVIGKSVGVLKPQKEMLAKFGVPVLAIVGDDQDETIAIIRSII